MSDLISFLGLAVDDSEYEDFENYESYDYNNTSYEEFESKSPEHYDCQTLSLAEPGSDYVGDVSVTASGRKQGSEFFLF